MTEVSKGMLPALLASGFYTIYLLVLPIFALPFIAIEFDLDDVQATLVTSLIAIGTLGTYFLTRLADTRGRRKAILLSLLALPPLSLATAFAPSIFVYTLLQMLAITLYTTLQAVIVVTIAEEMPEKDRAKGQALFGLVAAIGGSIPLLLTPFLENLPGGWRFGYGLAAIPLLFWPLARKYLLETKRFQEARNKGTIRNSQVKQLFQEPYRKRSIALLASIMLRSIGVFAVISWAFYHGVKTLELETWIVTTYYFIGGGIAMVGIPIGVYMCNHWGRRPGLIVNTILFAVTGTCYYWVPADLGLLTPIMLGVFFCLFTLGLQAVGVAERCVDTELFPTHLRATYLGFRMVAEAIARILGGFSLSLLVLVLTDLHYAITLLTLTVFIPAMIIFAMFIPETNGLDLDTASLETE